jgi:DNA-binding CsgD family transcriptional regulator
LSSARALGLERGVATVLAANLGEALLGTGDWARAEAVLAAAVRTVASFWSHHVHVQCAALALGRGDLDAAEESLRLGAQAAREPAGAGQHAALAAELALWRGSPDEAAAAVDDGLRTGPLTTHLGVRTRVCALGVRAEADRIRIAAARRDSRAVADARSRADRLLAEAERCAATGLPDAEAWAAVARAEHGPPNPSRWEAAVDAWDRLGRPYQAARCRRYHAAVLLGAGGSTVDATRAARDAYRVATDLGARLLQRELERLARIARLNLAAEPAPGEPVPLGLTSREDQVLRLVARGYSNREIATELAISPKTASVHVSHIMRKLGVSRRLDAAQIADLARRPSR